MTASPPTAGTARFANDIESWSSAVRISGRVIGTHPMSETAVAKLVRNETVSAIASHHQFGARDRVPELLGIADLAQQREDRDQRAHRHEQVRGVDAVELLERRFLGAGRGDHGRAQRVEPLLELLAGTASPSRAGRGSARPVGSRGARRRARPTRSPACAAAIARSSPTMLAVLTRSSATSLCLPQRVRGGRRRKSRRWWRLRPPPRCGWR